MRTFLVFAVIGLYIVAAFVPPSSQNLQAAMIQMNGAKLFTGLYIGSVALPSQSVDLAESAKLLKELATRVTTLSPQTLTSGTSGKEYAERLSVTAGVIAAMGAATGQEMKVDLRNELAKKAAATLQNMVSGSPTGSAAWKKLLKNETDPVVLEQLQSIQAAIVAKDVRQCGTLPYVSSVERVANGAMVSTPFRGDYLAYCLARVTGERSRCDQIREQISPAMQSVCLADFHQDV